MDANCLHRRICLRLGTFGSMIVLLLCPAKMTEGGDRHRHIGSSRHTSNHHNFGRHSHSHHDQHGHHFIIHVPRYYLLSNYGFPVYYGRNRFYRFPNFRRPYYYEFGYSSGPAYNFSGYGGKKEPLAKGLLNGEIVNNQEKNGWELLADGEASHALEVFAQQVQRNPDFGGPKIGYALSAAVAGDPYFGVWEMRRASRINSSSMQAFKLPERLGPTVGKLIRKFKDEQLKKARKDDVSFMLASLHFLLQNTDSAKTAIDLAIRKGDRSQSARNLKRIIDQQSMNAQVDHGVAQKNTGGDPQLLFFEPPIPGQTK